MRVLTFMPMEEIEGYESAMQEAAYVPNTAQKRLAEEVGLATSSKPVKTPRLFSQMPAYVVATHRIVSSNPTR